MVSCFNNQLAVNRYNMKYVGPFSFSELFYPLTGSVFGVNSQSEQHNRESNLNLNEITQNNDDILITKLPSVAFSTTGNEIQPTLRRLN